MNVGDTGIVFVYIKGTCIDCDFLHFPCTRWIIYMNIPNPKSSEQVIVVSLNCVQIWGRLTWDTFYYSQSYLFKRIDQF